MRLPRMRFRVRGLMIAVAVVAALLAWAITRPYPVQGFTLGLNYVSWSDGRTTTADGPRMMAWRGNSWFYVIDWPDGSVSYYLVVR